MARFLWLNETTHFCKMIDILGKVCIPCLKSANNRNLQFLSFQKMYTLFYETCVHEAATTRGCPLGHLFFNQFKGIGHFRVVVCLGFEVSLGGQLLKWK